MVERNAEMRAAQRTAERKNLWRAAFVIRAENLSDYTYDELVGDTSLLNHAALALSVVLECDYCTALERLAGWVVLARRGEENATHLTLSTIFSRADTSITREAKKLDRDERRRLATHPRVRFIHQGR